MAARINYVGALPCLALFDDRFLRPFFSAPTLRAADTALAMEIGRPDLAPPAATATASSVATPNDGMSAAAANAAANAAAAAAAAASCPRRCCRATTRGAALGLWGAHRWARVGVHAALVAFIAYKSVAPLKELFSAAPWLHTYDDYMFVSSQVRRSDQSV